MITVYKNRENEKKLHKQIGSASNGIELGHIGNERDVQDGDRIILLMKLLLFQV